MTELSSQIPDRPLFWSDTVHELQVLLTAIDEPVYLVGGAVRDAYLHRPIKDLDLITTTDSISLARRITNRLQGDIFVMDRERGVARIFVTISDTPLTIDIARFRGETLLDDLTDRDFTINALAVDLSGNLDLVIDPLNGILDAGQKILRRCSPSSIANDPIRALRAVRQSVQLSLRIEPKTLQDIRQHSAQIIDASPERVRDEFTSLLKLERVAQAIRVADTVGLLGYIIPSVSTLHDLPQNPPHVFDVWQHSMMVIDQLRRIITAISPVRNDNTAATFGIGMLVIQLDRHRAELQKHINQSYANERSHISLLMLAALLHNLGKSQTAAPHFSGYISQTVELIRKVTESLRLSKEESQVITNIVANYRRVLDEGTWTPLIIHRFWFELDKTGIDVCLFALADYLGMVGSEIDQGHWLELIERIQSLLDAYFNHYDELVSPAPLLDGNDLMRMFDLSPGRRIGQLLTNIREAQVSREVTSTEDAVQLVRSLQLSEKSSK